MGANWLAIAGRGSVLLAIAGILGTDARGQEITSDTDVGYVPGRVLIKLKGGVALERGRDLVGQYGSQVKGEIRQIGVLVVDLPSGANEKAHAAAFRGRPEVEFAEPDWLVAPSQTPNDPNYGLYPSQLIQIDALGAWSLTTGSGEVVIAVLDSGVDTGHEDLASKVVAGWNAWDGNSNVSDVFGHGTQIAGVAAAATDNTTGGASIAWSCKLMPVRVTGTNGYASTSAIAAGLVWAADQGARVANLSFDLSCCQGAVTSSAQYFQDKGGVVVTAAGNNGGTYLSLPDNPYLLAVSAVELDDSKAWWSSYGDFVDLAAPKMAVTPSNGGGYSSATGTSAASAYVAGVAALMFSVNPTLTGNQVQNLLKQSAYDAASPGWDPETGWGRVDAGAAVQLAMQTAGGGSSGGSGGGSGGDPPDQQPPVVKIQSPSQGSKIKGMTQVSVAVTDNKGVDRVELYVDGVLKDTVYSGKFVTQWKSNRAPKGAYVLQCKAYDAAGNVGFSQQVTVNK